MYPEYVKEVEALGQNLFAELQKKAAKWAEYEPNISEWIREKNVDSLDLRLRVRIGSRNGICSAISTTIRNSIFKRLLMRLSDVQILQIKIRIFQPENRKS
jgi:hypothetical protein